MKPDGAASETSPPSRFSWRTFWIYVGLGPPIGATIGLVVFIVVLIRAASHNGYAFQVESVVSLIFFAYLLGFLVGGPPAIVVGMVAGRLQGVRGPIWRALAVSPLLGALTSSAWLLALNGFHATPADLIVPVTVIGAATGGACALIQRGKSASNISGLPL